PGRPRVRYSRTARATDLIAGRIADRTLGLSLSAFLDRFAEEPDLDAEEAGRRFAARLTRDEPMGRRTTDAALARACQLLTGIGIDTEIVRLEHGPALRQSGCPFTEYVDEYPRVVCA